MVRAEGLEPPHRKIPEPKSGASTNFATPAAPSLQLLTIKAEISDSIGTGKPLNQSTLNQHYLQTIYISS